MTDADSSVMRRFFAGLTEYTFTARMGVADPPLLDYLTGLLTRFVRQDTIGRFRDLAGRRLHEVVDMLTEAEQRVGEARREIHRHIGDVTLFWSGVYPEALRRLRAPEQKDHLIDYAAQGKRAYHIAASIEADTDDAPAELLERLSAQFDLCRYGLHQVRREWERRDDGPSTRPFLIN